LSTLRVGRRRDLLTAPCLHLPAYALSTSDVDERSARAVPATSVSTCPLLEAELYQLVLVAQPRLVAPSLVL